MATKSATIKIPKSLAVCADLYCSTRDARLALQKEVDLLEENEKLLKAHLIDHIPKSDATGIAGKLCRVSVTTKQIPKVDDWDAFYSYVAKNKSKGGFALMNRAVNAKAVAEIWDAGKAVPGVSSFTAISLSLNKIS
jgi:hypothetical protein